MDCRVASTFALRATADKPLLAMTLMGHGLAFSRHDLPGVLHFVGPQENQRAQGRPDARCTRGLMCNSCNKNAHMSIQEQRRTSGLPCAMALRLIRGRPGDRLCLSPSPCEALASSRLDTSNGVPGPHDFTVRNSPFVLRTAASTATCPSFATMANAPLTGQDGGSYKDDLPDVATGIFLSEGLDRFLQPESDLPVGLFCRRPRRHFPVARDATRYGPVANPSGIHR